MSNVTDDKYLGSYKCHATVSFRNNTGCHESKLKGGRSDPTKSIRLPSTKPAAIGWLCSSTSRAASPSHSAGYEGTGRQPLP